MILCTVQCMVILNYNSTSCVLKGNIIVSAKIFCELNLSKACVQNVKKSILELPKLKPFYSIQLFFLGLQDWAYKAHKPWWPSSNSAQVTVLRAYWFESCSSPSEMHLIKFYFKFDYLWQMAIDAVKPCKVLNSGCLFWNCKYAISVANPRWRCFRNMR